MAGTGIHCELCDRFFHKNNEYVKHCEGRKHRVKELLAYEHDLASRRLFVRGIDWIRDPQMFLHSYFCNFGKLNNISFGGKQGSMYAILEFQDQESISRALKVKHTIERHTLTVRRYKYQPQHWEKNKLTNEEFQEDEKQKQAQAKDEMLEILLSAGSLTDQISLVAESLKLDLAERRARVQICEELTELFAPHFENCRVFQFGSSVNGFGAKGCDLDLFLDIDDENGSSDKSKVKKLSQILSRSPGFAKIMIIPSNRCPVVRFIHQSTKIKCDLSINNRKALHNSYLLRLYSTDERVHMLVSIVRLWARSQGLTGTLGGAHLFTSYAITLIVLYFLMHRKPRIIPLVCDVQACVEGTCKEVGENWECLCIPSNAELPPSENKDSEVGLVREFFAFFSESINWDTDALIMKDATVFPRGQISQDPSFIGCKAGCMTVIDPFVLTHNVVANVNEMTKVKFITELKRAAELTYDWPKSVQKLESQPWGVAALLVPNPDQTTGKSRKKSGHKPASTPNVGQGQSQGVAANAGLASKNNTTRVEGEQENGDFCITVQPVSNSLTCAQLLITAKKNNVTPAEQWCNMAQELILNVLKSVFMVEVEEVNFSKKERTEKACQDVDVSREHEEEPQNGSEMKDRIDATNAEDDEGVVKDDYVLVDVAGSSDGQAKDEVGCCKRSSDAAHLDGSGIVADADSTTACNSQTEAEVGNPKKFCEGITQNLHDSTEIFEVVNPSIVSSTCKIDGDDSSNACTDGKSNYDDCCMEVANESRVGLERHDTNAMSRSSRDQETGGPSVSEVVEASADTSTKEAPEQLHIPSTSARATEVRTAKVFSYACKCKHQVWIDRKRTYSQIPQKHGLTALALEQEVTKLVLARKDVFLQKVNAADQGQSVNELGKSPSGQQLQGQSSKTSLVKNDLKKERNDPHIIPVEQNTESTSQTQKVTEAAKKTWPQEVEFSCQIVHQNCDVDFKLPHILIKLKPSLSSSKQFRNFFSAFRSQILRLISEHFLEMSV